MKNRFLAPSVDVSGFSASLMNPYSIKILVSLFLILVLLNASNHKGLDDKNYDTKLQIINNKSQITHDFLVKIVKSDEEKAKGLMFVTKLPDHYGMLFEFWPEQIVHMWMKNTKIPLDMLFISKDNQIVYIQHNASVDSTEVISSKEKVAKVLEINANQARRLGIDIGDRLIISKSKI